MSAAATRPISSAVPSVRDRRDWFLRDSAWTDVSWHFAPTSLLEEEHPVRIAWDFTLDTGGRFTDAAHGPLLESARRLIAIIRARSLTSEVAQRATTALIYFNHLRVLIRWMASEAFDRFEQLDAKALDDFKHMIQARKHHGGKRIRPTTVELYLRLFTYLYRYRTTIGDGLIFNPWLDRGAHSAAGVRRDQHVSRAYTPDAIAVPLVQTAIDLLESCALDILRIREGYADLITQSASTGTPTKASYRRAAQWLQTHPIKTPFGEYTFRTLSEFYELIDLLYAACFIVIAYLVGARVSEILHLKAGCLEPLAGDHASSVAVLTGAIFKLETGYHGRAHQWVVPEPAVHAVTILEALSARHRLRSGRSELWLRTQGGFRTVTEWEINCGAPLWIPSSTRINQWLARFASRLSLPEHKGAPWHFSTHQGRKTFARFVALRDRTGLLALAQHLGHRDRAITDTGYAGTDYALLREIEAEVLEQSVTAWEHMLSEPQLGGRAGTEIHAKRPRFHGQSAKQEIKDYARLLVESGLTLGVCDWGILRIPRRIQRLPRRCVRSQR